MKNYYDVLQFLKQFGVFIYVGKRLWDIELTAIELEHLYKAGVVDQKTYLNAKLILDKEHREEEKRETAKKDI